MLDGLSKEGPTPEAALEKGFVRIQVDVGEPSLNFSTLVRKGSVVLQRNPIGAVIPSGFLTVASIYKPEQRARFSIDVDAFVFEGAVEAQPCADEALQWRDYVPTRESGQRGLLVGGGLGFKRNDADRVAGAARTYAVVRGRTVLVIVMQVAAWDDPELREEGDIFVSNLRFDSHEADGFRPGDIERTTIPLSAKPLELAHPGYWNVSSTAIAAETRSGTVVLTIGDKSNPSAIMTFGFRRDDSTLDAARLDAWGARIAHEYVRQNPNGMSEPKLVSQSPVALLNSTGIANSSYIFGVELTPGHQQYQIRVLLIGDQDKRFAFSLLAATMKTGNVDDFVNYACAVSGFEIAVDSFMHWLTGKGF